MMKTIAFVTGLIERNNHHPVWKIVKPLLDNGNEITLVHHSNDAVRCDDLNRFVLGWPELVMKDRIGVQQITKARHMSIPKIVYRDHSWDTYDRIILYREMPAMMVQKLSHDKTIVLVA